ncbi:MAG: hypothetical protein ACREPR_18415, partial [Brasilonema sp.]
RLQEPVRSWGLPKWSTWRQLALAQRDRRSSPGGVKSQKYYGMGFLGILNGCSIYPPDVLVQ